MSLKNKLKAKIYEHIIYPIMESCSPISHAAWGTAIGMFWGLTPTVGIQMWLVWITWLITRVIFKTQFDLVIGTAMVWISNPITMLPMYYGFLVTGYFFFESIGQEVEWVSYESFTHHLNEITGNPNSGTWEVILEATDFLILDLGFPMIMGSLFYAIPFAILSYFVTHKWLLSYRTSKAQKEGLSYEDWRAKYEKDPSEHNPIEAKHHIKEQIEHLHEEQEHHQ